MDRRWWDQSSLITAYQGPNWGRTRATQSTLTGLLNTYCEQRPGALSERECFANSGAYANFMLGILGRDLFSVTRQVTMRTD